jgi:tyrosine-protein phosphatase SIW14
MVAWSVFILLVVAACLVIKYGRHYVLPRRFAVVEPGALYRSGYCEPWVLARLIRKYKVRTILVLLNNELDSKAQQKEQAVAKGARLIRIGMPGDGCADFELIDRAAEVIADESYRPLLVHCWAGVNRTGMAYAAWRMRFCAWNADQALVEAIEHGYSPMANPQMREHLRRYYETRVASSRPAGSTTAG